MLTLTCSTHIDWHGGDRPSTQEWLRRNKRVTQSRVQRKQLTLKAPEGASMTSSPVADRPFLMRMVITANSGGERTAAISLDMEKLPTQLLAAGATSPGSTDDARGGRPDLRRMAPDVRKTIVTELMPVSRDRLISMWLLPQMVQPSAVAALLDLPDSKTALHPFEPTSPWLLTTLDCLASEFAHLGPSPQFVQQMMKTLVSAPDEKDEETRAVITLELHNAQTDAKQITTGNLKNINMQTWTPALLETRETRIAQAREERVMNAHQTHQDRIRHRYHTTAQTLTTVWFAKEFSTLYQYEQTLWDTSHSPPVPRPLDIAKQSLTYIVTDTAYRAILSEYTWRHTLLLEAQAVALQGFAWGNWPDVLTGRQQDPLAKVPEGFRTLYSPRPKVDAAFAIHEHPHLLQHQLGFLSTLSSIARIDQGPGAVSLHTPPAPLSTLLEAESYKKVDFATWSRDDRNALEMQICLYFLQVLVHPVRVQEARDSEYSKNQMLAPQGLPQETPEAMEEDVHDPDAMEV